MPSSTSSSESPTGTRPLPRCSLRGAVALAALLTVLGVAAWEMNWRNFGATPSYKNSNGLWAEQRRRINNGEGDKTVILGSSRIFFDFQLDVWERLSGERPIQLALEGTSPMGALEQLADDPDFTGRLIVGVTPALFFSGFAYRGDAFEYYRTESPSQRAGQFLSTWIEPWFAFYQPDFALFTVLARQPWPARDGVNSRIKVRKLANYGRDRNARLWDKVENDPAYQALAKKIWEQNSTPLTERDPKFVQRLTTNRVEQIDRAAAAVEKLRKRGIQVIFVRAPSGGGYTPVEAEVQPREEAWDVLLERTGAPGIHFADHETLQGLWLPEWSHLAAADADRFTAALYAIISALPED